uniref:Neuroglian n=1 Tax=Ascaris suum TaxID=6253 RepID=F1KVB3_ASCSU
MIVLMDPVWLATILWLLQLGQCVTDGRINVLPSKMPMLPQFVHRENEHIVYYTLEATQSSNGQMSIMPALRCKAEGNPKPTYTWKKNGKLFDPNIYPNRVMRIPDEGSLLFVSMTAEDEGVYQCEASNSYGAVTSETIVLQRACLPNQMQSAFVSKCDSNAMSVTLNFEYVEDANYSCPMKEIRVQYQISGGTDSRVWSTHQHPQIREWLESVVDNRHIITGSLELILHPYGEYRFRLFAQNDFGDGPLSLLSGECRTSPRIPTKNPERVSASGSRPDNLIVFWKSMPPEDWNGRDFHYVVRYHPLGSKDAWKEDVVNDPYSSRYVIDFPVEVPFRPYEVQVLAVNAEGRSSATVHTVQGHTGEGNPNYTPSGFKVVTTDSTSATFAWDAVDRQRVQGNLTAIKIITWAREWEEEDQGDSTMRDEHNVTNKRTKRADMLVLEDTLYTHRKETLVASDRVNATVFGLQSNTVHYAQICVRNGQHDGPLSVPISFRLPEGVPNAVRQLEVYAINNRHNDERAIVIARWKKPFRTNGNLLKYTIEACQMAPHMQSVQREKCPRRLTSQAEHALRFTNLDYDSKYRFIVYGSTAAGDGDPNSKDVLTLPQQFDDRMAPVQPILEKSGVGNNHINITITPGQRMRSDHRPVGNVMYVRCKKSDTHDWVTIRPEGDDLAVHIGSLEPGTKYDVVAVALQENHDGNVRETESAVVHIFTTGDSARATSFFWLGLLLLALSLVLVALVVTVLVRQNRGDTYPLAERERKYGNKLIRMNADDQLIQDRSMRKDNAEGSEKHLLGENTNSGAGGDSLFGDDV